MIAANPARAEWHEATSTHFIVYSNDDPKKLTAFTTDLERFDRSMRIIRNAPDTTRKAQRVTVYMLRNMKEIARLAGNRQTGGFYIPRVSGAVAFVPREGDGEDSGALTSTQVLQHEYAHHFMYDTWGGMPFPSWLIEGFAEFNATSRVKGASFMIGAPPLYRAYGMKDTFEVSMDELLTHRPSKHLTNAQAQTFYGRSWLLTHYLIFEPSRVGQLDRYLAALIRGSSLKDAAAIFGDSGTLDADLNRYASRPKLTVMTMPLSQLTPGTVTLRKMRPGESAMMPIRIRSDRGVDATTAPDVASAARKTAADYPADPQVQVALAEAEFDARGLEAADAAAARALTADPKLARAMMYRGMAQMAMAMRDKTTDQNRWRAIRGWFVAANAADSDDPWPLVAFYHSFQAAGLPPTRNAQDGLMTAHQLAPYDRSLTMNAAVMLLRRGDVDLARNMLQTVAFHPHGGSLADTAVTMLAKLAAKDTKGALAVVDGATMTDDAEN